MSNKTILIADDDANLVAALKLRCHRLGVNVRTASNGLDALAISLTQPPDLLLLDVDMPAGDGLAVCERLLRDQEIQPFPVIFLTGRTDAETIRRCESLGAHYLLKGDDTWENLHPLIRRFLEIEAEPGQVSHASYAADSQVRAAPSAPKVMIVDDDPQLSKAIAIRLEARGIQVVCAENGRKGYWMVFKEKPDVILTDLTMPELSGEALMLKLAYTEETKNIPVFVLTGRTVDGHKDVALEREMLGRRRCAGYFTKPMDIDAFLKELQRYIPLPASERH